MKKLKIVLENCYGIDSLDESFDFSKKQTIAIYAPNGVMKTSFAKTFEAVSIDKEPKELLFGKLPTWEILSDEVDIDKNDIEGILLYYKDHNTKNMIVKLFRNKNGFFTPHDISNSKTNNITSNDISDIASLMSDNKSKTSIAFINFLDLPSSNYVINDLQRSAVAYRLFQGLCFVFQLNDMSREDGLISILRGFKKEELIEFSKKLRFNKYNIQLKWAFRYQWIISKI